LKLPSGNGGQESERLSAGSSKEKPWRSLIISEQINNQALFSSAMIGEPAALFEHAVPIPAEAHGSG
jgi:hypothetical protein